MIGVQLRLVRSRSPATANAWLLPGGNVADWLAEIPNVSPHPGELRLFVVPAAAGDRRAAALLVVPPEAGSSAPARGRAMALARRGSRLLLPADAQLWPPVHDAELDAMIGRGTHLFHPVHGLVAFTDEDALRVSDLLVPTSRRDARWDAADPGLRRPSLRGVHATEAPTAETVLASGKGDASTQPLEALPPSPGETPRRPGRAIRDWIAKRVLRFTRGVPSGASSPTWIDGAERWANRQIDDALDELRRREIERLLHLLRSNPDVGLQFALPIAGVAARGVAPPGGTLPARRTDFDVRALAGGGPADPWVLSVERTRDLSALYRQQAERAIRLGQHRRAAYVLAHLLGDLRGAAAALERGRHWREAAALHRERLGDAAAAAACLERGGLLTEAISLHLELGDRLKAAALLDRVGRRPEAERLWREVVAERRAAGDRVGAAALLGAELRVPEEALAVLDEGWPRGGQADFRLRAALKLLGTLGRGDEACRWIRRTREVSDVPTASVVGVLAGAAASHPDARCRALAADTVRVLVGVALTGSRARPGPLLGALASTDPGDRLLRRDAVRFATTKGQRRATGGRKGSDYAIVGEFDLPDLLAESVCVHPRRGGVYVCGVSPGGAGVEFHSFGWDGRPRSRRLRWELVGPRDRPPVIRVDSLARRILLAFPGGGPRLFSQAMDDGEDGVWSVLTPSWIPDGLRSVCAGAALTTWTITDRADEPGFLARCHGQAGGDLRTVSVSTGFRTTTLAAVQVGRNLLVAASRLLRIGPTGGVTEIGDDFAARELVAGPRHLSEMVVATGDVSCGLWTGLDRDVPDVVRFAEDADFPKAAILGDGRIVVLDPNRVRLHRREDDRVRCLSTRDGLRDRAWVTVVSGRHDDGIAAVTRRADGTPRLQLVQIRFHVSP